MTFRSEEERRFASWLRKEKLEYHYEKIQFMASNKSSYTPDFYIEQVGAIIEVKPIALLYEFNDWRRSLVEQNLKKYNSVFFVCGIPINTPEIYKAFDVLSGWIDDLDEAKSLFKEVFKLRKPLPPLSQRPNANPQRTYPRPLTEEEKKDLLL